MRKLYYIAAGLCCLTSAAFLYGKGERGLNLEDKKEIAAAIKLYGATEVGRPVFCEAAPKYFGVATRTGLNDEKNCPIYSLNIIRRGRINSRDYTFAMPICQ